MASPKVSLFRDEAVRHYLRAEDGRGLVRVSPPWTWILLAVVMAGVVAALVAAILGHVEVNGRGRGILRPVNGVRTITSQVAGSVARIETHSGQAVDSGTVLLRIDSPALQSQLLEAERQFEAMRTEFPAVAARQDGHQAEQVLRLHARIEKIQVQIASLVESVAYFDRRLQTDLSMELRGLESSMAVDEARDALAQRKRQMAAAEEALNQARQELASLEGRRQDDLWQRQQILRGISSKRDALAFMLDQTVLKAPEDGTVEALLVRLGDAVQLGQTLAKLIPRGAPLQVVSFLAERDRAFVKPGDEVHLEFDQLPYAEYGTLRARVLRISDDLASPYEIREALGEDQKLDAPTYRVELEVTDTNAAETARIKLRTGMLMNVRYLLRRQTLMTLVLDPLRRWFR